MPHLFIKKPSIMEGFFYYTGLL
ncbi:uncharacterized protein METZ01_LOCUS427205, partial [marine metagenome]